jgi:hypothetical protein
VLTLGALALAERRRPTAAVAVLALATLTKVYPVLLLPLLLRHRGARVRGAATFAAICAAAYLPHVLAVGTDIVGYLPGYLQEESYSAGSRYLLLGLCGLRGALASVIAVLLLAGLALWALRTRLPLRVAAVRLMAGVLLVVTPVQPWYAVLLLALAALAQTASVIPLTVAAYPLFFGTVLAGEGPLYGRLAYGTAAAALGYALVTGRLGPDISSGSWIRRTTTAGSPRSPRSPAPLPEPRPAAHIGFRM